MEEDGRLVPTSQSVSSGQSSSSGSVKEASFQPPAIQSALLDGKYFRVTNIEGDKIRAICEMCPKDKTIISVISSTYHVSAMTLTIKCNL